MTPEYANQLIRENSQLRQKVDETAVYVQKMEDNQDYHLRVIRNQAQQIKQLEFAINCLRDAAIAKVKAVYEYKVAHGIINPVTGEDMQPEAQL